MNPMSPPEVMIGCHKTVENQTERGFSSGSFDEIAIWRYWLNDTVLAYFLGGYSKGYNSKFLLFQILPFQVKDS